MVKVLCRGGPYYWVRKPYSDLEERMFADDPVPPLSKAEQKIEKRHYPDKYFLLDTEVWPMTKKEEAALWAKYDIKQMTFYGGAPHRPSSPQAAAADTEQTPQAPSPAARSSQDREP